MTTTSVEAEGGDASGGGGGDTGGGGDAGGGGQAAPFYEAFTRPDLKTSPSVQRFANVEALAEGYVNLEKRFGVDPARRIDLPADPNDKEGMRAVFAKLGLPEKPDGYGFKLDDKATDGDKAFLGRATAALHEAGVPKAQAEAVFKFWGAEAQAAQTAAAEAQAQRLAEGKATLEKEWGGAFAQRSQEVGRLLDKYASPELKAELEGDKLGNYPGVAIFLGKLLDRMAEPGAAGGQSDDADTGERALTPSQATAKAREIEAQPAFRDKNHPQHKALVAQRAKLLAEAA